MKPDDFDWEARTESRVIIPEQAATAAFRDSDGHLIIRQHGEDFQDDVIVITRAYIPEFVANLQRLLAEEGLKS